MSVFEEKRVLIIAPKHKMIFEDYKEFGYNIQPTFFSENIILRLIREFVIRCHLPLQRLFLKKVPDCYDLYIIYDSLVTNEYVEYISSKINSEKIYFFLDNIVGDRNSLISLLKSKNIKIVTLEKTDAEKYDLIVINDFFNKEYISYNDKPYFDVVFFGKDKGRLNALLNLKKKFDIAGLKTYFHITKTYRYSKNNKNYKKEVSYKELLSYVANSRAILEILQEGQNGLTLRAMEALFFKKKLITSSKSIKKYDFYRQSNIFVLGEDDESKIVDFINSPYETVPEQIIEKYEFKNAWTEVINKNEK